jgi:hypothetical protein
VGTGVTNNGRFYVGPLVSFYSGPRINSTPHSLLYAGDATNVALVIVCRGQYWLYLNSELPGGPVAVADDCFPLLIKPAFHSPPGPARVEIDGIKVSSEDSPPSGFLLAKYPNVVQSRNC